MSSDTKPSSDCFERDRGGGVGGGGGVARVGGAGGEVVRGAAAGAGAGIGVPPAPGGKGWGRRVSSTASSTGTVVLSTTPSVDLDGRSSSCYLSDGEADVLSSNNSPAEAPLVGEGTGGRKEPRSSGSGGLDAAGIGGGNASSEHR